MKKSELNEIRNIMSEEKFQSKLPTQLKASGVKWLPNTGANSKPNIISNVNAGNTGLNKWVKTLNSDIKKLEKNKDDKALWLSIHNDLWTIIAIAQKTQHSAEYGTPKK